MCITSVSVHDLNRVLIIHHVCRFDFVVTPLVHPRFRRGTTEEGEGPCRQPLTRSDKLISSADWMTLVVAKLSPWIQLDSTEDAVRRTSEKVCTSITLRFHSACYLYISFRTHNSSQEWKVLGS